MFTRRATATFSILGWDEKTWDGRTATEVLGEKQTYAVVSYAYLGDIEGTGEVHYLMTYDGVGSAYFTGLERIEGTLAGRKGSFVVQHLGTYGAGGLRAKVTIVSGSGKDDLKMVRGEGSIVLSGEQSQYPIQLDYDFD